MKGMSKKRFLRTLAKLVVAVVLVVGVVDCRCALLHGATRQRAREVLQHRKVSKRLSQQLYQGDPRELRKKDPAPVMGLYSDRFWSPGRGHWEMAFANEESDVSVSRVVIKGQQDFDKQALRGEVVKYLASIASITNIWTKIDMIERSRA